LNQDNPQLKQRVFDSIFELNTDNLELGLSSSVLVSYLENNDVIDGWILRDLIEVAKNGVESQILSNLATKINKDLISSNDLETNISLSLVNTAINGDIASIITQYYGTSDLDKKLKEAL